MKRELSKNALQREWIKPDQLTRNREMKRRICMLMMLFCVLITAVFSGIAYAEGENAVAADPAAEEASQHEAAERGLAAIRETRFPELLVLPKEESYLQEWKIGYARKAFKAPCLRVERISQLRTGRQVMPYIYEGVEATVVAEENNMSCMIYRGNDNRLYAGWIQSIRLLDEFPGNEYTVGKEPGGEYTVLKNITVDWSKRSWLTTQQNYSVLSEEVKNCRGFTLEYQIIAENTSNWASILGDRTIYVKSGDEWIEVGSFAYPDFGAVKIHVYLDKPTDINAVGTIADCTQPSIFRFRQTAYDFLVE